MPNRCSVANCTSNYDGYEYAAVFQILHHWPKDVQDNWRKFLHRDDAWLLNKVYICTKHLVRRTSYFLLKFPKVMVLSRSLPVSLVFAKVQSPLSYLFVHHTYKIIVKLMNVLTEMN